MKCYKCSLVQSFAPRLFVNTAMLLPWKGRGRKESNTSCDACKYQALQFLCIQFNPLFGSRKIHEGQAVVWDSFPLKPKRCFLLFKSNLYLHTETIEQSILLWHWPMSLKGHLIIKASVTQNDIYLINSTFLMTKSAVPNQPTGRKTHMAQVSSCPQLYCFLKLHFKNFNASFKTALSHWQRNYWNGST